MGLAPLFIQEIFDIIQDIQKQGTTVLLIEQNANKAASIADRGYVLETGNIVCLVQEKNCSLLMKFAKLILVGETRKKGGGFLLLFIH